MPKQMNLNGEELEEEEDSMSKDGDLTERGYRKDEVTSALQKDIRRGNTEKAMYWARELVNSGQGWYLFHRLKVISMEDIMKPKYVQLIDTLDRVAQSSDYKRGKTRLAAVMAAKELAEAPKSRYLADRLELWRAIEEQEGTEELKRRYPIPEYALDSHTKKGNIKGRGKNNGWKYWIEESSKLNNIDDEKKERYKEIKNEIEERRGEDDWDSWKID